MAALAGRRFVTASEVRENTLLNEGTIKAATGQDDITARFLHREYFTFAPTFKLVLCVNHMPKVSDTTHSFWRRIKVIPFERKFSGDERDNNLLDKLKKEASGILSWAVEGCLKWQKEGLKTPEIIQSATNEYRTEMDIFRQFLEDCTIEKENSGVDSTAFFQAYEKWCESNGEDAKSGTWVGRKMKELEFKKERGNINGRKKTLYKKIVLLETQRNEEQI